MQQPFKTEDVLHLAEVPFRVKRVLDGTVQIENEATSEIKNTTVDELLERYRLGTLKVGRRIQTGHGEPLRTDRANADTGMERMGDKARVITLRRIAWTTKVSEMGGFDRPKLLREVISRVASELEDPDPPHPSTLYRWRRKLERSKKDVRALFARLDMRGGRGLSRLSMEVEAAITEAIDSIFLKQKRSSAAEVLNAVRLEIQRKNAYRTATDQLPMPSLRTIQSRIARLYAFDVCAARHGPREAYRKLGDSVAARPATRILEIVEIDHTPVDLWVVDENGKVIGKPTLTALLCRYSRCCIGFFLSLAGHGVDAVFGCIHHALMPKTYLRDRYPEIQNLWECFGWFEKLLADNGSEFAGRSLEDAMLNLGIVLEFCSAYEPNDKPFIERFLRTFNHSFIHRLKGTSLAKVHERKGEKLEEDACITLPELERLIHVWIVDVYHRRPHAGLDGRAPAIVWAESAQIHPPRLKADAETIEVELSEVEQRSLGRGGVEINSNRYTSERLCSLRRMLPSGETTVKVKFRRGNVGHVFVLDPFSSEYFRVDNVKAGKEGISVEQDQLVRNLRKAADPDDALQVAAAEEVIRDQVSKLAEATATKGRKAAAKTRGDNSTGIRGSTVNATPSREPAKPEMPRGAFETPVVEFAEEI